MILSFTVLVKSREQSMECKERIYCIEGFHGWDWVGATVEPMLELLQRLGSWDYLHRTCSTTAELKFRLKKEWNKSCDVGSILYFFTHGDRDQIWLREDDEPVGLLTLKEWPGCKDCHIHFGGCSTFGESEDNLKDLMNYTGATSVSGYAAESYWLEGKTPAILLELQLFWYLSKVDLAKVKGRAADLDRIEARIADQFPESEFRMLVRRYRNC